MFHKHKKMADGHINFCKVCHYEKNKTNRLANPESRKVEHVRLRERQGFMTMAEYTAKRNENPKGKNTSAHEWAQRNKPAQSAYRKQYEVANKERIQARSADNIEMRRETKRLWVKNNLGLVLASSANRRAAKLQRTPTWLSDFDKIKIKCLYQLAAMRNRESGQTWHVDHIIPLQGEFVSGLHVPSNLQVIPAIENMRKSNHYGV
jgi:hypothetical protein